MPEVSDVALLFASGGMNAADNVPWKLTENEYVRATNVELVDGMATTRHGIIIRDFTSDDDVTLAFAQKKNFQGAKAFNPGLGQGALTFAAETEMILMAFGGRKLVATWEGKDINSKCVLKDISNGIYHNAMLHQIWWGVAENIALMQDGEGVCFIWSYPDPATTSAGYNTVDKQRSRIPNAGTLMVEAFGRLGVVVNRRLVFFSDGLNTVHKTNASDLLSFQEQTYFNTGTYFTPPSIMGDIVAFAILPQQNSLYGYRVILYHCRNGIFSLNTNIAPRSVWATTPMQDIVLLDTGATGQHALCVYNGDQFFRSRQGIQTLRSAASFSQEDGDPHRSISLKARPFLENDYPRWLAFASVDKWMNANRVFCTVYPIVSGKYRWHRGIVSYNVDPFPVIDAQPAWEGLWTFPRLAARIMQLVNSASDDERQFAICQGNDGINRIAEFTQDLTYDLLPDGTKQPISSQLTTRGITAKWPLAKKQFTVGTLFLRNIRQTTTFGVWFRTETSSQWVFWKAGRITIDPSDDVFIDNDPGCVAIPLGQIPSECSNNQGRYMQFLIRWIGYATFESIRVKVQTEDIDEDKFSCKALVQTLKEKSPTDYNDWEYSTGSAWLDNLTLDT
jgi:hypothetical protein